MSNIEEKKEQPLAIHYKKVSPPNMFSASKNVEEIKEIDKVIEPDKLITSTKVRKTRTSKVKEEIWQELVNKNKGKSDYDKAGNFSLLFSRLWKKTNSTKKNMELKKFYLMLLILILILIM